MLSSFPREVEECCSGRGFDKEGDGVCELEDDWAFVERVKVFGEEGRKVKVKHVKIVDGKISKRIF